MNSLTVGALAFGASFGGAVLGMTLGQLVPQRHMSEASKDAVKVATAVVATLAALVTGLLVSTAKSSFDTKDTEIKEIATRIELMDRAMAEYGAQTAPARMLLKNLVEHAIAIVWGAENGGLDVNAIVKGAGMTPIQHELLQLVPQSEEQQWFRSTALQLSLEIDKDRGQLIQHRGSHIYWPFVAILVLWFALLFLSFGLYAPRNVVVLTVFFTCSLSLATAFYLIVQMDTPYSGYLQISNAPLRDVLVRIDR